jgi:hypothetical protein
VTAEGLCEAELAQTRLKELMARRASAVYVLAHGAKLERRPFHAWARLDPGWTLITDASAEPEHVDRLRNAGITVVIAGVAEASSPPPEAHATDCGGRTSTAVELQSMCVRHYRCATGRRRAAW